MATGDYYKTLGVSRDASDDEIKKAFRTLARKYHPDVTGGDKDAEDRFKKINEAYEVLSNPDLRGQYDQFGHVGPQPGFDAGGFGGINLDEILGRFADAQTGGAGFGGGSGFEEFFSGGGGGGGYRSTMHGGPGAGFEASPGPSRGADLHLALEVDFTTASRGGNQRIQYRRQIPCADCSGSGKVAGGALHTCPACGGRGKVTARQGPLAVEQTCTACAGTGKTSLTQCSSCGGDGRIDGKESLTVKIPEGVSDRGKIRLSGKGNAGTRGGWPGDLIIELEVKLHPYLRRDGKDVHLTCPITPNEAVNGASVTVPTLDGSTKLKVPKGVRSGQRLRLRNKGLRDPRGKGARGHQYVELQIVLPLNLDDEEKAALARIDERTGFDPRKDLWD